MTAVLSSRGKVVIPQEIRERLRLKPGSRVEFVITDDGHIEIIPLTYDLKDLKGIMGPAPSGRKLSISDMNEAIAESASERYIRSR